MASESQDSIPKTAPALVHDPGTHALSIQDLPVPTISGPEEHLIRVHAVALTNGELNWPEPSTQAHPIPGYEVAGTVVSGPADSPFLLGSRVYARTGFDRPGSARPYSIALTSEMGRAPSNLSWEEAATVPMSALTAWQALFVHGGVAPPEAGPEGRERNAGLRLLVTAAAGGVGLWIVQLARLAGVGHVVGVCGASNAEFVKWLGAHEIVDYKAVKDLPSWLRESGMPRFDLVLDAVGGDSLEQSWLCVRDGGLLISVTMPPELRKPTDGVGKGVRAMFFIVEADGAQLDKITALIVEGTAKAVLDSAFGLENYEEAFKRVHGGHLRGKVVLTI